MKKLPWMWFLVLGFVLVFQAPVFSQNSAHRGLYVSVIQTPPVLSSRDAIKDLIAFAKKTRVQALFVQVYRANRAWFPSNVADAEPYQAGLKSLSEDPLALLIREAHGSGIEVHAWLNLLSLSANEHAPLLKKYGTGILTRNQKRKRKLKDYKIDDQYFLEPGDLRVREELAVIVGEILKTYPDLDGIQFDYIRYPDMHPAYGHTKMNRDRFMQATGLKKIEEKSEVWRKWKRDQVTGLLEVLVKKARAMRPGIQISTTGCMPYVRAYHEAFQDWRSWVKSGLIDFVTLMCYHIDDRTLEQYVADAKRHLGDLRQANLAVGAYTFLRTPELFVNQWGICEDSRPRACVVLHYGNFLENQALVEPLTSNPRST